MTPDAAATVIRADDTDAGQRLDRVLALHLPELSRTRLKHLIESGNVSENGAALKERLGAAIRQDVEKALQGDRALSEQVSRVLSGRHRG